MYQFFEFAFPNSSMNYKSLSKFRDLNILITSNNMNLFLDNKYLLQKVNKRIKSIFGDELKVDVREREKESYSSIPILPSPISHHQISNHYHLTS